MTAGEPIPAAPTRQGTATGRRALRGGMAGAIGLVASILITFLVTPFILSRIGPAGYGLFILVSSFVAYGSILDLGIGGAVVKLVAEYRAIGQPEAAGTVVATALRLYSVLALVCLALTFVTAALVPSALSLHGADATRASLVVMLMGINLALSIFATPAASVMAGLQRYDVQNGIGTIALITNALATVGVLALGGGLVGMVAVNIPITIGARLASSWYIRRAAPELTLHWSGATGAMARRIASISLGIFAAQASGPLQKKTDEIVIGAFLAVSAITPYALARKLSEVAHQVTRQFVKVLLPIAASLQAVSEMSRLRELYLASTRATLAIFLSMAILLVVYPDLILTVWVGAEYAGAGPLVAILVIASIALTSVYPAGAILQGMGRFRLVAVSSIISGLTNLGLSIMLVQRVGVLGVAIGTLVPTTIEALLVVTPYTLRVLGIPLREVIVKTWVPALSAIVPAAVILVAIRVWFDLTSLPALLVGSMLGSTAYLAVYFAFPQAAPERAIVADMARRVGRVPRRLLPGADRR